MNHKCSLFFIPGRGFVSQFEYLDWSNKVAGTTQMEFTNEQITSKLFRFLTQDAELAEIEEDLNP